MPLSLPLRPSAGQSTVTPLLHNQSRCPRRAASLRRAALPITAAALLLLLLAAPPASRAQEPAPPATSPGCTLADNVYTCSLPALRQALASAHTVAIVSDPPNRASDAALRSLAQSLGKTVVSPGEGTTADLTLLLQPFSSPGVRIGPNTSDLARLRISANTPADPAGRLVWNETYNGELDMPWPTVVRALTRQFKTRLGLK